MVHWERQVRSLLRPSEHLNLVLVGTALLDNLPRTCGPKSVILAVVGNMPAGLEVEESGRSIFYTSVPLFCAELLVKVCLYTESRSAIQHRRLSVVPSSHSNIYSQFMEIFLSKYVNSLQYCMRPRMFLRYLSFLPHPPVRDLLQRATRNSRQVQIPDFPFD